MLNSTIAVDIVLIPPEEVSLEAKSYNAELREKKPGGLVLDETHLPHITLIQLYASRSKLSDLHSTVAEIADEYSPFPLRIHGLNSTALENERAFYLTLDAQPGLLRLHSDLMKKLQAFEVAADENAFLLDANEKLLSTTVAWTKNFRSQASLERFDPHITIGTGVDMNFRRPLKFLANRLAICHLGNYNTCRKILWETKLG